MRAFFAAGGRLIDSSPMYGSSQDVVGEGLQALGMPAALFSADKVWTSSGGAAQVETSRRLWRVPRFDLLQVHNLLAWEEQLPMLQAMKQAGRVRYVGITTSEGRRHRDVEQIMRGHRLDFVQLTYNPVDREPEQRLLPLARERGIAVLANRPFQQGALLRALQRPSPARLGARHRLHELGAGGPEVHREQPGDHLRHPGHLERGPRAGEPCGSLGRDARRGAAPAHRGRHRAAVRAIAP